MQHLFLRRQLTPADLRAFRVSQNLNQRELAEMLGVSRTVVARAEAGGRAPLYSAAIFALWQLCNRGLAAMPPKIPVDP